MRIENMNFKQFVDTFPSIKKHKGSAPETWKRKLSLNYDRHSKVPELIPTEEEISLIWKAILGFKGGQVTIVINERITLRITDYGGEDYTTIILKEELFTN